MVTTNGSHANGVFAYSNGTINISDTNIKTSSNNSGALMVTGGGKLTANNVTAETDGNSSAPIRSDRGGGTLVVNGGSYTSHGTGSPVVYSTADITVNDAKMISTASEGVVVEGKNSVTLNNVIMEATNTKLNSNSETYKSIFIYQSMSGDSEVGTATFTAKDSKIINNKGDVIFVTNTNTIIELENLIEIKKNDELVYIFLFIICKDINENPYNFNTDDQKQYNLRNLVSKECIFVFQDEEIWKMIDFGNFCNNIVHYSRLYYRRYKTKIKEKKVKSTNREEKISPVKEIKICHGKKKPLFIQ